MLKYQNFQKNKFCYMANLDFFPNKKIKNKIIKKIVLNIKVK